MNWVNNCNNYKINNFLANKYDRYSADDLQWLKSDNESAREVTLNYLSPKQQQKYLLWETSFKVIFGANFPTMKGPEFREYIYSHIKAKVTKNKKLMHHVYSLILGSMAHDMILLAQKDRPVIDRSNVINLFR